MLRKSLHGGPFPSEGNLVCVGGSRILGTLIDEWRRALVVGHLSELWAINLKACLFHVKSYKFKKNCYTVLRATSANYIYSELLVMIVYVVLYLMHIKVASGSRKPANLQILGWWRSSVLPCSDISMVWSSSYTCLNKDLEEHVWFRRGKVSVLVVMPWNNNNDTDGGKTNAYVKCQHSRQKVANSNY
jgi:hypothetical protein